MNDLYVSPVIARALLAVDPGIRGPAREKRGRPSAPSSRSPSDITTDEFVDALQDALAPGGGMPGTVIILDEVQQYIGDDTSRSYVVQEIVEACSKRFGDRLLFVGTGQTALSGTPAVQRLQGRFTVNVELSDYDVETVIRRVVLAKRLRSAERHPIRAGGERWGDRSPSAQHPNRSSPGRQVRSRRRLPVAAGSPALLGAHVACSRPSGNGRPAPHAASHRLRRHSPHGRSTRSAQWSRPTSSSRSFRPICCSPVCCSARSTRRSSTRAPMELPTASAHSPGSVRWCSSSGSFLAKPVPTSAYARLRRRWRISWWKTWPQAARRCEAACRRSLRSSSKPAR